VNDIGKITQQIKQSVTGIIPDSIMILYGSYARGDFHKDSDIDILILLDKDTITLADRMKIAAPLYAIELETGVLISSFIYPKKAWEQPQFKTPFFENIMKEGIIL